MNHAPALIGVAIPVHDEQALLAGCLNSIAVAAEQVAVPVRIVVALDRCRDGSADVVAASRAGGLDVRSVESEVPGVGAARAAAVASLLDDADPVTSWLVTTDADSLVPPHWLSRQLDHARRGADMVIGTVRVPDWSEHPPSVRDRYLASYRSQPGHRHIHGANLAFRASRYLEAGGFEPVPSDEDVRLITRFDQLGATLIWAADVEVDTSARRIGRAPNGFAEYLSGLGEVP